MKWKTITQIKHKLVPLDQSIQDYEIVDKAYEV